MQLHEAIEHIRPSVVQMAVDVAGEHSTDDVLGSGFFVTDDGYGVTAWHVWQDLEAELRGKTGRHVAGVAFAPESRGGMLTAFAVEGLELVDEDYANDLVLFRHDGTGLPHGTSVSFNDAPPTTPPRPARLSAELPADGEPIAVSGYPLEAPSLTTTSGHIASNWAHFDMRGALVHQYFGDITVNPGNSGGPAYRLSDGAVIGVCSDALLTDVVEAMGGPSPAGKHAAGLATLTPSTVVRDLMLKNGVHPLDP